MVPASCHFLHCQAIFLGLGVCLGGLFSCRFRSFLFFLGVFFTILNFAGLNFGEVGVTFPKNLLKTGGMFGGGFVLDFENIFF